MIPLHEIENLSNRLYDEILLARKDANARIGKGRRIKLGDFNLREGLYDELRECISTIYTNPTLRRNYFYNENKGPRHRLLLLVFMSELIYWEYESSFWQKLYDVLRISNDWSWFTNQMGLGFDENNIPLITWTGRNEYVRTILLESGFSKQLVLEAKKFVFWFFEIYSDLDPRSLDKESFKGILTKYENGRLDNEDIFDLLREMVFSVSKLLREIRKRFLSSEDLKDPNVLLDLEETLGFHPIRGIFGFRRTEDIEELLETLTKRIKPNSLRIMLKKRIAALSCSFKIRTPDGITNIVNNPQNVCVMYGLYKLITENEQTEIQVVPRESISLSKLGAMINEPPRMFHIDGQSHAWVHDSEPFDVSEGNSEPESAIRYSIGNSSGFLWYGRQKVALPTRAERDGQIIAELSPKRDISFNPRVRLNRQVNGLEVSIPSFTCFEPKYAGRSVKIELNGRKIENTTYVINNDGLLQFQTTRVADVLPDDDRLEVSVVTLSTNEVITKKTMLPNFPDVLLFNRTNRERILPGDQELTSSRLVLFSTKPFKNERNKDCIIESETKFGKYNVFLLNWNSKARGNQRFEINIDTYKWTFTKSVDLSLGIYIPPIDGPFLPKEFNSVFTPEKVNLFIESTDPSHLRSLAESLSLLIEKDDIFLTDYQLSELINDQAAEYFFDDGKYVLFFSKIIDQLLERNLIERSLGVYKISLMMQLSSLVDLKIISEVNLMILPKLSVTSEADNFIEGKEFILNIKCEQPLIADSNEKPVSIIRIDTKPDINIEKQNLKIVPKTIESTIRLVYPPTKVTLFFTPHSVYAIRLLADGKILSKNSLTYNDLDNSELLISGNSLDEVLINIGEHNDLVKIPDCKQIEYNLIDVKPYIQSKRTAIKIEVPSCFNKTYDVNWHVKFFLVEDEIPKRVKKTDQSFLLAFNVEGPPHSEIIFQVFDNKLRIHSKTIYQINNATYDLVELTLLQEHLSEIKYLNCRIFYENSTLSSITIPIEGFTEHDVESEKLNNINNYTEELRKLNVLDLWQELLKLEEVGREDLIELMHQIMYTPEKIEEIRQYFKEKRANLSDVQNYLSDFNEKYFDVSKVPVWKLKRYCSLPNTQLIACCAKELIRHHDAIGVDAVIEDLMLTHKIDWKKGKEILRANHQCSAENIRDRINLDELENESDETIELLISLAEEFYPTVERKAKETRDWKRARKLLETGEISEIKIIDSDYYGLTAAYGLLTARIPTSEIDAIIHDISGDRKEKFNQISKLKGMTLKVIAQQVDRKGRILFFSEKIARQKIERDILLNLKDGSIVTGTVTAVKEFGCFVDIGGAFGLIHISEIFWERNATQQDLPSIGQEVNALVVGVDDEKLRANLSIKRLSKNPLIDKYQMGTNVTVKITNIKSYGIFGTIENKVTCFIPRDEILDSNIKINDKITARILRYDDKKEAFVLSIKQANEADTYWGIFRVKRQKKG